MSRGVGTDPTVGSGPAGLVDLIGDDMQPALLPAVAAVPGLDGFSRPRL